MKNLRCLAILALALGCGPSRPSADAVSSASSSSEDMSTTSGTEDADTEPEPVCEPISNDHVVCDGECVWLTWSDDHCGECDHACTAFDIDGHCREGRCTAVRGECLNAESGFSTCNEYCASIGELCGTATEEEGHPCYGNVFLYETDDCKFNSITYKDTENPAAACDWIIPFGAAINAVFIANSARCCCTQHGGE